MNKPWIGIIPAAGKGLRLGLPYPKELYPIIRDNHYKPVSQFIVDQMVEVGIQHIVFVINETKHQLLGYFGSGRQFGCSFSYVYQDRLSLNISTSPGLAQALDSGFHLIKDKIVFFGMPDTIIKPTNVFKIAVDHFDATIDFLLCLFPTETPEKFGMVRMDRNNNVVEIIDKPPKTDLQYMWGCIVWNPIFTNFLHEKIAIDQIGDFAVILNKAVEHGLHGKGLIIPDGSFNDLGTYDEILKLDTESRLDIKTEKRGG